ncbi:hypothetical protein Esti_005026 [Eimeria stiedai]
MDEDQALHGTGVQQQQQQQRQQQQQQQRQQQQTQQQQQQSEEEAQQKDGTDLLKRACGAHRVCSSSSSNVRGSNSSSSRGYSLPVESSSSSGGNGSSTNISGKRSSSSKGSSVRKSKASLSRPPPCLSLFACSCASSCLSISNSSSKSSQHTVEAGVALYFCCCSLGIASRCGVWECLLYLLNLLHNHSVSHSVLGLAVLQGVALCEGRRAALLARCANPCQGGQKRQAECCCTKTPRSQPQTSRKRCSSPADADANDCSSIHELQQQQQQQHAATDSKEGAGEAEDVFAAGDFFRRQLLTFREEWLSLQQHRAQQQRQHQQEQQQQQRHEDQQGSDRPCPTSTPSSGSGSGTSSSNADSFSSSSSSPAADSPPARTGSNSSSSGVIRVDPLWASLSDCSLTWHLFCGVWLGLALLLDSNLPLSCWLKVLQLVPLDPQLQRRLAHRTLPQIFIEEVGGVAPREEGSIGEALGMRHKCLLDDELTIKHQRATPPVHGLLTIKAFAQSAAFQACWSFLRTWIFGCPQPSTTFGFWLGGPTKEASLNPSISRPCFWRRPSTSSSRRGSSITSGSSSSSTSSSSNGSSSGSSRRRHEGGAGALVTAPPLQNSKQQVAN